MFTIMAKWITPSEPADTLSMPIGNMNSDVLELPDLPGVDTVAGLATCQGNSRLYKKLLLKFRDGYTDFSEQFIQAQSSDDIEGATRCAHTLKGVAGNIAAKRVQQAAETLELACKEHVSLKEIELLKDKVVQVLSIVLDGLNYFNELVQDVETAPEVQVNDLDKEKFQSLTFELRELLEDDDTDAIQVIEQLEELPGVGIYRSELKNLSKSVNKYEFEEALEILDDFEDV